MNTAECCPSIPQAKGNTDIAAASQDLVLGFRETAMLSLLNRCFDRSGGSIQSAGVRHICRSAAVHHHPWVRVSRDGGCYAVLGDPESNGLGERPHGNWQNSTNRMNGILKWLHTHTHIHTHTQNTHTHTQSNFIIPHPSATFNVVGKTRLSVLLLPESGEQTIFRGQIGWGDENRLSVPREYTKSHGSVKSGQKITAFSTIWDSRAERALT